MLAPPVTFVRDTSAICLATSHFSAPQASVPLAQIIVTTDPQLALAKKRITTKIVVIYHVL